MSVPLVLAEQTPSGLRFWCDWCRRHHLHSGAGHRVAHCTDPDSPYRRAGVFLVDQEDRR